MSRSIAYLRILVDKVKAGAQLNGDLVDRALGEMLELEKDRDILVVSTLAGHWAVPFAEGRLRELREAAAGRWSPGDFQALVRARGGMQLVDETYHDCSFYSHVVVQA